MTKADILRNNLIEKILAIKNTNLLKALNQILESATDENDIIQLTPEQHKMLEMSEKDIASNNLLTQEELDRDDLQWLDK